MIRALSRFAKTGKPFERLAIVVLRGDNGAFRWVGVFVKAKRLVFFPGYASTPAGIDVVLKGKSSREYVPPDHFSLDIDRNKWHVTSQGSKKHWGGPRAVDLGKERRLWFEMSANGDDALREVAEYSELVELTSPNDVGRRRAEFHRAVHHAELHIIEPNRETVLEVSERFHHFGVVVGPRDFPLHACDELAFPYGGPFVDGLGPQGQWPLGVVTHRISLTEELHIQVSHMYLPGKLRVPCAFVGGG